MSDYVTNAAWVRTPGRPDAIDDIADQFERRAPQPSLPVEYAPRSAVGRWPRSARGWRSAGRLHPAANDNRLMPS